MWVERETRLPASAQPPGILLTLSLYSVQMCVGLCVRKPPLHTPRALICFNNCNANYKLKISPFVVSLFSLLL